MKRDEMLKKVETLLNNLDSAVMSNKLKALAILDEVEKYGMQAPEAEFDIYTPGHRFFGAKDIINEWEN